MLGESTEQTKTNPDIVMTVITCNARFLSASLLSDWLPLLPDQHQTAPDYRYVLLRPEKWQVQGQRLADDLYKWNEDKFYLHRGVESDFIIDRMLWNVEFRHMGWDGKKCSVWKLKLLYNNPNWFPYISLLLVLKICCQVKTMGTFNLTQYQNLS